MSGWNPKLYCLPKYYDIAFSRDVSKEINFYISCFKKYCSFEVRRILEPACGSGIFLLAFPRYGYHIVGYDISPEMVEYANEKIREAGLQGMAKAVVGDMADIRFGEKFDAAIIAINSLGYLQTDDKVLSHFKCMSECLVEGGLYIVELSCACQNVEGEKKPDETWVAEQGGVRIEATWKPYRYDTDKKLRCVNLKMRVQDNGKVFEFEEEHTLKLWYYDDLKRLVEEGGFTIKAIYTQEFQPVPLDSKITGELGALYFVLVNKTKT
ncbi:MAG: class I SAM-dependent methyltransferase [Candidatus Freyarchaeota archaeon]|nr:class I SAM-dependent methyltransferase [Candidatus Jordarchaeia archaeon]